MFFNILLTLLLVSLNGFFVAAEFAIVKVRLSQIELRIQSGSRIAKLAKHLVGHMDVYLSATQLGITLASLSLGWIGEPVVTKIIIDLMNFLGIAISEHLAHNIALPAAFVAITVLHIVLGEQAPKTLAIRRPEKTALFIAIPLRIFYFILSPFIRSLNFLSNQLIKLIGFGPVSDSGDTHTEDELRYLLKESKKAGEIEDSEHKLIENVFEFTDTPIKQIMVPRGKIVGLEISMAGDEILNKYREEGYSRMPVYEKIIDNIVGVLNVKDLINFLSNKNKIIIKKLMRPPIFVQEEDMINRVLRDMQRKKVHLAIVLDEFGGTAGLVTMEDIIEEIVGEIQDEYDEETPIIEKTKENEFIVKSSATINDANDYLNVHLPESDDYETVGGLIISAIGRIPELNEKIELDNYNCIILKRSKRYVELVKLIYVGDREEEQEEIEN